MDERQPVPHVPDISNTYTVQVGEVFKPFEGSWDGISPLNADFEFKGLLGHFFLRPEEKEARLAGLDTPLGPARVLKTVTDGQVKTEEIPLILGVDIILPHEDDLRDIEEVQRMLAAIDTHSLELSIGGNKYRFRYVGTERMRKEDRVLLKTVNSSGREVKGIVLPHDLDRISRVEAKFVEKAHGTDEQQGVVHEPVTDLEVGQAFRPFEDLLALPGRYQREHADTGKVPFKFRGITSTIDLMPVEVQDIWDKVQTPLGDVTSTKVFSGNRIILKEKPFTIGLGFAVVSSLQQFHELANHVWEFKIGSKTFRCGFETGGRTDKDVEAEIGEGEGISFPSEFVDIGDEEGIVFLPSDVARLREIEVTILPRNPNP